MRREGEGGDGGSERLMDGGEYGRWSRAAGKNLTQRLFSLLLADRTRTTCGNNQPPNVS